MTPDGTRVDPDLEPPAPSLFHEGEGRRIVSAAIKARAGLQGRWLFVAVLIWLGVGWGSTHPLGKTPRKPGMGRSG